MSGYNKERNGFVLDDGNLIRIQDKNNDGNVRISIYDGDERGVHDRTTINYNTNTGKGSIDTHNEDKSDKATTNIICYLTTACMKFYSDNFDDNCYELTMMRWLRDNIVSDSDKLLYYLLAPKIVENIDNNTYEKRTIIYSYIYENVLIPCINLIEQGQYQEAYDVYKNSFMSLAQSFTELPKSSGLKLKKYSF